MREEVLRQRQACRADENHVAKSTIAKTDAVATVSLAHRPLNGLSHAVAARRRISSAPVPVTSTRNIARNIQPIGDWLKACRLPKMPLRVRKAAKLQAANVATASTRVVRFRPPRWR